MSQQVERKVLLIAVTIIASLGAVVILNLVCIPKHETRDKAGCFEKGTVSTSLFPVTSVTGKELVAKIWTDKNEFKVNEPIIVHYQVKNVSETTQIVWHSGFWPNHKIVVLDAMAKEIQFAESGEVRRNAFNPGGPRNKNYHIELGPGEVDDTLPAYDIHEIFMLEKPGKYTIQYLYEEYQGGWEGKLWSNQIKIEIVE